MNHLRTEYNKVYKNRDNFKKKQIFTPYNKWIEDLIILEGKDVLDFGSNTYSKFYYRSLNHYANYHGYDIDKESIEWLKQNKYWIDFWTTEAKFDVICLNYVWEHLTYEERIDVCKRARSILKDDGILLIDMPFVENFNGLHLWKDYTHRQVSSVDDPLIIQNQGFVFDEIYLVGYSSPNPFALLLNILCFGNFQNLIQIVAKKD